MDIQIKDMFLLIAGAFIGLFFSYILVYLQFSRGNGKHRMNIVAEATRKFHDEFKKPVGERKTSPIRDKYRYGLGVLIDDLEAMDEHGFKDFGSKICPLLIENGQDRWGRFNHYVRPVVDDINAYVFLRTFASTSPLRQLGALMDLCIQIEVTVMYLDAAFDEYPPIAAWKTVPPHDGEHLTIIGAIDDTRVVALTNELKKLQGYWTAWKKTIGIKNGSS